jgi:hypothetical protein
MQDNKQGEEVEDRYFFGAGRKKGRKEGRPWKEGQSYPEVLMRDLEGMKGKGRKEGKKKGR